MTFLRRIIWNITNIPLSVLRHALQNMLKSSNRLLTSEGLVSYFIQRCGLKILRLVSAELQIRNSKRNMQQPRNSFSFLSFRRNLLASRRVLHAYLNFTRLKLKIFVESNISIILYFLSLLWQVFDLHLPLISCSMLI